ncbi:MAG: HAMP domain-containing sensor histidine kinase [Campylobacterota bacterium]|nr:HAMP domain-containing sensor histidine kinase [Campylobacterota bacterium]
MKFKSIKTKVLFWFGTATTLLLLLFNFVLYKSLEQNTKLRIQNQLYNKAAYINKNIMASISMDELLKDKELENIDVAIIKEDKIIYKKGSVNFDNFKKFIDQRESFFVFTNNSNMDGLYVLKIYNPFEGAILFYERKIDEKIEDDLKNIKKILIVLEPILIFLLIFVASKLTDKILKSIRDITETANQIYVTDLSKQIPPPKYDDEIKDLVDSFNHMIARLKGGVDILNQFNSDVSHELKTPLTVIKGEVEITLNKDRDIEYYVNSLKTIEKETEHIQEIVDNLLLLTKYNKDNIESTFESTSLDSLLLSTIEQYNIKMKQKDIKLHIQKIEPIEKNVNHMLIEMIFSNIIDNAIKYSEKKKNIYISLYIDDKIHFIVEDEGIGIPAQQIENITNRFFRVDESRNKKVKGFGLGLAIVKNSIELHNGEIKIESVEDKGTKVEVIL